MRPRRTIYSNFVFRLEGGTEDNDLWCQKDTDSDGDPVLRTTWQPSEEERERIAAGENIELIVWGVRHPAVTLDVTDTPLGRPRE
jgi:hypothetical protein